MRCNLFLEKNPSDYTARYNLALMYDNTNKIDLQQAINRERNFLVDKQTVLIDEAKASGSWSEKAMFINTLKTNLRKLKSKKCFNILL